MIVYHVDGRILAIHADGVDAPAGSYPGAARRVVANNAALERDENDVDWLPYALRGPSADDVRAEAQRRIVELVGARDLNGCLVKQLNMQMRATELTSKRALGQELTADELAEAARLQAAADAIKAIRAASNAMEAAPPDDYASNGRWP